MLTRLLLEPTPEGGGGNPTPTPAPTPTPTPAVDPTEGFKAALKKHGDDALGFARSAYTEAETLRRENAELKGKLPKDGAVTLDGEALATYQALAKLGKPDEVATALEAGKAAIGKVSAFEREKLLARASEPYGFDPEVLAGLPGADGLRIELKDGTRNGKPAVIAEVVAVESKDGKDVETRTPLDRFAEKAWPKFLPALKAGQAEKPRGTPRVGAGGQGAANTNQGATRSRPLPTF